MAQSSSSIHCQSLLVLFLVLPHTSSASACYSLTSLLSSLQTPLPPKPFPTSHWAHATLWQTAQLIGLSNSLCGGWVCLSGSSDKPKGVLGSLVQSRCPINIWLLELRGSTPQGTVDCTKNRVCPVQTTYQAEIQQFRNNLVKHSSVVLLIDPGSNFVDNVFSSQRSSIQLMQAIRVIQTEQAQLHSMASTHPFYASYYSPYFLKYSRFLLHIFITYSFIIHPFRDCVLLCHPG